MTEPQLDIAAVRRARPYSRGEQAGRLLWTLAGPLFRFSPRPCFAWRRALLRAFGARIGARVHVWPTVVVALPWQLEIGDETAVGDGVRLYSLGPVVLGARVTVSQRAHLCAGTRDHRRPDFPLVRATIRIGDDAWVGTEAFVGPGVRVGRGAVVGARAVVTRDVPDWLVVAGNPARQVGRRALDPDGR